MSNRSTGLNTGTSAISGSEFGDPHHDLQGAPDLQSELRRLQKEVLRISNFERERIGQELHDDITQNLAGLSCLAKQLQAHLREFPILAGMAGEITEELGNAIDRIRAFSHELAPYQLENAGLVPHLRSLTRTIENRTGVSIGAVLDTSIQVDDATTRLHLYRISQEAIRNAIRHGKATQVTLKLHRQGDACCCLTIADNGHGFYRDAPSGDGLGIRLMQHRCREIGATLALRNAENGGAIVQCVFPNPAGCVV